MASGQAVNDMGNWDVMNPPVEPDGQAYTEKDFKTGRMWVCCPFCGKRNLSVDEDTKIQKLRMTCKCKREFEVNIE